MPENFSRTVQQIADTGISDSEIARVISEGGVDVSQPTISRLRTGRIKAPSYELGVALKALHKKRRAARNGAAALRDPVGLRAVK
jgi:predicted transcriptional regulator